MSEVLRQRREVFKQGDCLLRIPHLWFNGAYFYCDGRALCLRYARQKLALMRAFFCLDFVLEQREIIKMVYGGSEVQLHSPRYLESLHRSMLRMICDTRIMLKNAFGREFPLIEWLPYDHVSQGWKLFRFYDQHVVARLFDR